MSSTNRGGDRHASDYYVTPITPIRTFLVELARNEPTALSGTILDPCAGGDESHPMSYPTALSWIESPVITLDVREDSPADWVGDYLQTDMSSFGSLRTIITNPPFSLAEQITRKAIEDVEDGGFVIMLLRLNFLGSEKRRDFWDTHRPKYAFVHRNRLSFTEDGKTDSIEYAHFVWQKGYNPEFCLTKVI